ncbi:TFIIH/NER complex subunit [Tilletia horrida]|uniref:RNA polymerase II transcription factor B subunit 3 n=1 Tax=Tilletia horrida TaxID=155126 RepID=A0AAN6JII2_9BASI|nr:TFIIH/NER complex subunit [Tilletia horrida]
MSRRGVSSRGLSSAAGSGLGGPSSRPPPSSSTTATQRPPPASSASRPGPSNASSSSSATTGGPSSRSAAGGGGVTGSRVAARGPGVGGGGGSSARVHDPSGRISEYWSPDDKCPQCKTDRLIAPKLRLLVSPCYHKMCESCVDRIFSLGSAPCPQCGTTCRKNQFGVQTFSDLGVEREVDVRRRVARIYNKQEKDFPTLQAYNDYLEEVEEITFNLIHRIDLERTEARIAMHEHANRSLINRNAFTSSSASAALASAEEAERAWRRARASLLRAREEEDRVEREREVRELLDVNEEEDEGEEGESEAVRALKGLQAQRRRERAESRRREDEEAERQRVAMMGALAASQPGGSLSSSSPLSKNGAGGGGEGSGADGINLALGLYRPWQPEMLFDFEGPLARLDDARALFDIGPPPARLLGSHSSSSSSSTAPAAGSNGPSTADPLLGIAPSSSEGPGGRGYVDLLNEQPRTEEDARKVRVGGYDWAEVLRRRMRAAVEGLWIAPVGEDEEEGRGKGMDVDLGGAQVALAMES